MDFMDLPRELIEMRNKSREDGASAKNVNENQRNEDGNDLDRQRIFQKSLSN